ncbi:glycoside hydrolase family 32 protein [Deinococcus deserti]|uniref:Putative levanase n=1 Tax=Deinococcus deserti (strain DSM 17065 / CIP 109153 / LMG 22923 / VCD115) TaxID=546414 RepID=C1D242_DEIDV|nr:glycoside hydrolase family 32 protein [Deinococcus deserti]ACO47481.2 putative levanase [Deinococcus deserti VCD115]
MSDEHRTYRERHRPQVHYSPRQHWVNDPNGLVFVDGIFHLFYQHNPLGLTPGNLSWGHATSTDLLHWTEHPVALPARETHVIYSGSAVVDWHNTSGLGNAEHPPLVALYTGHTDVHPQRTHLEKRHHEAQYLAFSADQGHTWQYGGDMAVLDLDRSDFRDPKVFRDEARGRWVMVVVHPDERQVEFYASSDLHVWLPLSTFGPAGEVDGIWEVPEFFPLTDEARVERWVLKVDFNPGGPYGGSGAQYWVGDFDGTTFSPLTPSRTLDSGKDFYAALSWSDLPARRVWLAWMNNWEYATVLPTSPWRGAFTVPREVSLGASWHLVQRPVPELQALRQDITRIERRPLLEARTFALRAGAAHEFNLMVHLPGDSALQVEFLSAEGVEASVQVSRADLRVTRPEHPDVPGFGGTHVAPLPDGREVIEFTLLLDTSSVEVFAAGGRVVLTDLLLPAAPVEAVRLQPVTGRPEVEGTFWWWRSIWGESGALTP